MAITMTSELHKIFSDNYFPDVKVLKARPLGSGHIHQTFFLALENGQSFVLQKFNTLVFKDAELVHRNVATLQGHIAKRAFPAKLVPDIVFPVPATSGKLYTRLKKNTVWRLFPYVKNSRTFDVAPSAEVAFAAGAAFGGFIRIFHDLPVKAIKEPIPGFHQVSKRLHEFDRALHSADPVRRHNAAKAIEHVESLKPEVTALEDLLNRGELLLRITHNDTKLNNLLFDNQERVLALIDLDTVAPGLVHFDYGDAIRTIANEGNEDSTDLDTVRFAEANFKAFTMGFLENTGALLSVAEKKSLFKGPRTMTFIMALRFLTDYLNNDLYFKTEYPEHNHVRARAQLRFMAVLDNREDFIKEEIAQNTR